MSLPASRVGAQAARPGSAPLAPAPAAPAPAGQTAPVPPVMMTVAPSSLTAPTPPVVQTPVGPAAPVAGRGPTTSAAPAPTRSGAEPVEIVRRSASNTSTTKRSTPGTGPTGIETSRVVLALAIVLGMIFAMRYVGRKFFPAAAGAKTSGVIRVLSRSAIAPRQQFLLVQVGRRLIVVGDSGTSMNSLAEITDPDEVAALVGQVDAERSDSVSKAFGSLFGKARQPFESMTPADVREPSVDDEVESTVRRGGESTPVPGEHESVSHARGELSGLTDQVRLLSKQFKRS